MPLEAEAIPLAVYYVLGWLVGLIECYVQRPWVYVSEVGLRPLVVSWPCCWVPGLHAGRKFG